jgi:phage-related minor tail protein
MQGFGSFATMNAGVASSTGLSIADLAGAFAGGGDPPVGQVSLVGENGPELFVPRAAGTIIPNGQFGNGGSASGTVHYNPVIHIDSRTDQAQIHQLVSKSVAQGNADLVDHLQRSGKI